MTLLTSFFLFLFFFPHAASMVVLVEELVSTSILTSIDRIYIARPRPPNQLTVTIANMRYSTQGLTNTDNKNTIHQQEGILPED
jgi:hypothetical protein